ncbi:YoaK family protein [Chachezhania sediminis]|uniref:YoaK family protein n=1 Tax=Chachezhania sediminis TaxID=2599291 RepID=UPI00131DE158|nr:YoaK family protein [Chachezhania sediminis]
MLINVGQDRTVAIDLRLAVWLSLVAGAVNAAGFRALGYFSANMTGNVSTLSDMLAIGRLGVALWFASLVLAFIFGAFVSALLVEAGQARRIRGIYAFSILAEALLLVILAALDMALPIEITGRVMMVGLSFVMGLQNAATTRISDARVRTSHVSGIATDIGIELAQLLGQGRHQPALRSKLLLHVATLAAFFGGGLAGVWGYERIGPTIFLLVAALLVALAVPELRRVYAGDRTGR